MQTFLLILVLWLCLGIMADLLITFSDKKIKKNYGQCWYVHLTGIICTGLVSLHVVCYFLIDEKIKRTVPPCYKVDPITGAISLKTVDKFSKS